MKWKYEVFSFAFALLISYALSIYVYNSLVWDWRVPFGFYVTYKAVNFLDVKRKISRKIGVS